MLVVLEEARPLLHRTRFRDHEPADVRAMFGDPVISLFPSGEPLRVSIVKSAGFTSICGALIGFVFDRNNLSGIIVLEDGTVSRVPCDQFSVDWRYDAERDRWIDVNVQDGGETDQDV